MESVQVLMVQQKELGGIKNVEGKVRTGIRLYHSWFLLGNQSSIKSSKK